MDQAIQTLKNIGVVRLAIIASVIVAMGSGLHYLTSRVGQPEMVLLYANLDASDAGKIMSRLETMGVDAEIRGGGTEVYAPASKISRLRMDLAEAGLPRGGSIGYEIFDKSEAIGTSGFVQDINHLRALEGEIARTITTLAQVDSARVHLVLPRREIFSKDRQEPSAAIVLTLKGPGSLNQNKVQSIRHLVASAVPGLTPERVSIVDDRGNLLARGDDNVDLLSAANVEEMRIGYENRLSHTIESLVGKHVGADKVRADVAVDVDFDRLTENSEEFNPDQQVIRSSQSVEEGEKSADSSAGAAATTVANQAPGGAAGGAGAGSSSNRKEQTVNYEISKKVKTYVKESGAIKRISVAVLVDGNYKGEGDKKTYEPRPKEELEQITKLVQNAIGYKKDRGDSVEVINMQFAEGTKEGATAAAPSLFSFSQPDIVRLIESLIIGVMGLLMLLMVVKPLLVRILEQIQAQKNVTLPTPSTPSTAAQGSNVLPIPQPQAMPSPEGSAQAQLSGPNLGQERPMQNLSDIVEAQPEESADVVRQWIQEK